MSLGTGAYDLSTSPVRFLGLLLIYLLSLPVSAQTINLSVSNNITATAELMQGSAEGKSILLLHGFLQTRDFFTVRRLADSLHEEGHTVLLPTLSLGVDQRRQSLACEAIHTHSIEQDVKEIALWVDWLSKHQNSKVTLIGHSIGSLLLLAYLDKASIDSIHESLFISLIAFIQGPIAKESEEDRLKAVSQLESGDNDISEYPLAFCEKYATTPKKYLSYMSWDTQRTVDTLKKLNKQPVVILGDNDKRLGNDWLPRLQETGVKTVKINGANHFFNHEHEFELADTISEILE
jgi:pimeloyl-ACP methyl ester carboxylesterase